MTKKIIFADSREYYMLTMTVVERGNGQTRISHKAVLPITQLVWSINQSLLWLQIIVAWVYSIRGTWLMMKWTNKIAWYDIQDFLLTLIPSQIRVAWNIVLILHSSITWGVSWQTA